MKKLALFCIASLCTSASMATSNYTSSTGTVMIPDVSVDGTAAYDSVTLQLNFKNNTFSVLNTSPKTIIFLPPPNPLPDKAIPWDCWAAKALAPTRLPAICGW